MDKQVAHYIRLNSWLFWTLVNWLKSAFGSTVKLWPIKSKYSRFYRPKILGSSDLYTLYRREDDGGSGGGGSCGGGGCGGGGGCPFLFQGNMRRRIYFIIALCWPSSSIFAFINSALHVFFSFFNFRLFVFSLLFFVSLLPIFRLVSRQYNGSFKKKCQLS